MIFPSHSLMLVAQRWRPAALCTALLAALSAPLLAGCYHRPTPGARPGPAGADPRRTAVTIGPAGPVALYSQAGLLAQGEPLPFVGSVEHLAGRTPDTTLTLLTLSLANRVLTFGNEGDGQRASYQVTIDVRHENATVKHVDARETVRVGSFRETSRTEESIIFQQFLPLPPGQYVLSVAVRDEGSSRTARSEMLIIVPRLDARTLSSPVPVYRASARTSLDSVPKLVTNPRATLIFGRDSVAQVYFEGYALPTGTHVELVARGDREAVVWRDTVTLDGGAVQGRVASIPVAQLGVGRLMLSAAAAGARDTTRTPLFVAFGDEWAIASFDEMLNYLRYFASPQRLQALRDAPPEQRAALWGSFYRETDPDPSTPEHEGLRDYFNRLQLANDRFREEGIPGWLTDRGKVLVTLGEPDQVLEQGGTSVSERGRAQIWNYDTYRIQLVFIDQTGFGRWRLTSSSEADFEQAALRARK